MPLPSNGGIIFSFHLGRGLMESLWIALKIVAPLFLLMAVGYLIKVTGLMNETSVRQVNKTIFKIFLPLLVFLNIYKTDLAESFNSKLLFFCALRRRASIYHFTMHCNYLTKRQLQARRNAARDVPQ